MKFKIKGKRASRNDRLMNYLIENIDPACSIIDIGCGPKAYSDPFRLRGNAVLTLDAWPWVEPDLVVDLEHQRLCDVVSNQFDYALMIDFIEHLDRRAGLQVLEDCKTITRHKIYLLTPLPAIWTDNSEHVDDPTLWSYGNDYDRHKSSWTRQDFEAWTAVDLPGLENYFFGYHENFNHTGH